MGYRLKRNLEFKETFQKVVRDLGVVASWIQRKDLIELTIKQKASRTFISEEQAERFLISYLKNPNNYFDNIKNPNKREMQRHLIPIMVNFIKNGYGTYESASLAVHQEAPSFFISYRTARDHVLGDYYDRERASHNTPKST